MLCSRCKKRMAVVFVSHEVEGKQVSEGLCFRCAKELNIPQVSEIAEKMGISEEDIDNMNSQMLSMFDGEDFEMGGSETMNPFISGMMGKKPEKEISSQIPQGSKPNDLDKTKKPFKKNAVSEKPKLKFLSSFGINLTEKAKSGKLDRVIGRDKETYRVVQILSRRTKNNPCLIGEPGVGKTAIAEGIAQKIAVGDVPFRLSNKELYLLDMAALVAGTQFRGQFESRVKGLINEVKQAGNIILFIDEIHTLIGTGDSEGSMSAANILKPALSRGEIQLIGATTFDEYRKYIENDSALERRFQPVSVNEPNVSETVEILHGVKGYYENHHHVHVSSAILHDAALLSERYINDRFLPDKAIDLLDEACACCSLRSSELAQYDAQNAELKKMMRQEEKLEAETQKPDYEKIAQTKANISRIKVRLKELEPIVTNIWVTDWDLAHVIELWTGIPASKIEQGDTARLRALEEQLKKKIIGQDEAVALVAAAVRRRRIQLSKRRRPASFIFVGPTGVGKTELVKVLATALFDDVEPLIRLDMSEYMEKHTVARLVGSPPGYVGYDDAGQLTEKVRRRPYSVILFDEIEKAHPDVMNLLLQILDEGKITDAHGRSVNFQNTVIIMTSNAGSGDKTSIAGFNKTQDDIENEKAKKGLENFLRPEFIARVDEVVVFHKLTAENLQKIAALMLNELKEVMEERGILVTYDEHATEQIIAPVKESKYGARDLRKEIRKQIEDVIATLLIETETPVKSIAVSAADKKMIFSINDSEFLQLAAKLQLSATSKGS